MKVIKIGAVWCNACLVMRPRWQQLEREFPTLKTEYYDFDQDQAVISQYNLSSSTLPTFIFLDKNNLELTRLHGEVSLEQLRKLIRKFL